MKLGPFFQSIVDAGIKADPRGKKEIERLLNLEKKEFDKLPKDEKPYFDKDRLNNPYADSRLLHGDPKTEVRSVLLGIDIDVAEILLADRLRERGRSIDLVISHHPEGRARASFYNVMGMQADILSEQGISIAVAEAILEPRIKEVMRRVMPGNHTQVTDAARLLDIPFLCAHTPADNHVTTYLQKRFDREKPVTIKDVVDLLMSIPEYQDARRNNSGPAILIGNERRRAGKIFVDMTGGTGGSKEAFEKLANAGVATVVGMHIGEDHYKEAEKHHLNVVIAGHISSDTLGLNLLFDNVDKKGQVDFVGCAGFRRITKEMR